VRHFSGAELKSPEYRLLYSACVRRTEAVLCCVERFEAQWTLLE